MQITACILSAAALLCAAAAPSALAGGFVLLTGNPQASAEARTLNAAVTVKAVGCGEPAKAQVRATAIGVVNGKRQSLPLEVVQLKEPGMFAVARQWPSEGRWIIEFSATEGERTTTTIARVTSDGVDYKSPKLHASAADVAAVLDSAPVLTARK